MRYSLHTFNCNMSDIEHAAFQLFIYDWLALYAEQTLRFFIITKHVIQASTASSHRVGKCIIEPSKQSRIRKSSFWSHRRSTVQWETALSSKERSRRVNCPMIAPLLDVSLYVCLWCFRVSWLACWLFILSSVVIFVVCCFCKQTNWIESMLFAFMVLTFLLLFLQLGS